MHTTPLQVELFPSPEAHVATHLPDRGDGVRRSSCRCGNWAGQAPTSDLLALAHRHHVTDVAHWGSP